MVKYEPSFDMCFIGNNFMNNRNFISKGSFEVYFMGTKLYSKRNTGEWPNLSKLVKDCIKIYNNYIVFRPIDHYHYYRTSLDDLENYGQILNNKHKVIRKRN